MIIEWTEEEARLLIDAVARGNSIRSYDDELFVSDGRFVGLDYDYDISDKAIYEFFRERCPEASIKIKKKKPFVCHSLL